jgi:hypothetical protein
MTMGLFSELTAEILQTRDEDRELRQDWKNAKKDAKDEGKPKPDFMDPSWRE